MNRALMNQNALPIIGSGPLASAPVASAENQNMWYMSTDFGLCLSRRVVSLDGPDTIKFAPVASTLKGIDWMCSFCFLDCASSVASFATLFEVKTAVLTGVRVVMTTAGKIELVLRNAGGTVAYLGLNANYSDLLFHRIYLGIENGFFFAYTEKEAKQSIAVPVTWDGTGYTEAVVSDFSASARPLLVCGIRQNTGALVDCIQCDDALGTTTLANQCTPSRPATLSDASAHAYSWVPWSLLQ